MSDLFYVPPPHDKAFELLLDQLRREKRNPDAATAARLFNAGVRAEQEQRDEN